MTVKHGLFYEYFHYLLPFGLGNTVKTAEEKESLITQSINNHQSVCKATPGFALG